MAQVGQSILIFILAGLCEIGGGYLIWQSIRNGKGILFGVIGAVILILYGIIPTFQQAHFGRVYAAYGGVFVVMSLLWGWGFDKTVPDSADMIGALLCLIGIAVIMYWPRP
ncbi:MAG: YnfA family protein [Candidatus Omnitrophota bacterium]|nr:YnfA family protein [Candidatus Omnitrophota bacterium]